MDNLKEKLLRTNVVDDNEYLEKYCSLIESNINTKKDTGVHCHHIIPKFYYQKNLLEIDDSNNNKVNLLYKDHILAHYFLYKCGKDYFKSKNFYSITIMIGKDNLQHIVDKEYLNSIQYDRQNY